MFEIGLLASLLTADTMLADDVHGPSMQEEIRM